MASALKANIQKYGTEENRQIQQIQDAKNVKPIIKAIETTKKSDLKFNKNKPM